MNKLKNKLAKRKCILLIKTYTIYKEHTMEIEAFDCNEQKKNTLSDQASNSSRKVVFSKFF